MSRIGLKPIEIPSNVTINIDGNVVKVKGPNGELTQKIVSEMTLELNDGILEVKRPNESKKMKALHGLSRSLIQNMVTGVTEGFKKSLTIVGTGYRAQMNGQKLGLNLGYSHPLDVTVPEGIKVEVPQNDTIVVSGADKQQVGQFAAKIRGYRPPEPYLGKGIRYSDEQVRRKVGKTGK